MYDMLCLTYCNKTTILVYNNTHRTHHHHREVLLNREEWQKKGIIIPDGFWDIIGYCSPFIHRQYNYYYDTAAATTANKVCWVRCGHA